MTWNGPVSRTNTVPDAPSQSALIDEAIEVLEEAVDDRTLFLWTGGKEAQVIADLLLYSVGDDRESSPVPFGIIDTGNHYEELYDFREEYVEFSGDEGADTVGPYTGVADVHERRHEELLAHVIRNESDPRGYHGEHREDWQCPDCGGGAELENGAILRCDACEDTFDLHPIQRDYLTPDEWTVARSCGRLKVEPMRDFIEEDGYETLITGLREEDMIAQFGGESDSLETVENRDEPASHRRVNPLANWEEANVWAYLKMESVSYCELYDEGYRHTDSKCCTDEDSQGIGEYGEGGLDERKVEEADRLEAMGYL